MKNILIITFASFFISTSFLVGQESYLYQSGITPAWASFENPKALKGEGAKTNKGAKGFASKWILPGDVVTLMELGISDPFSLFFDNGWVNYYRSEKRMRYLILSNMLWS